MKLLIDPDPPVLRFCGKNAKGFLSIECPSAAGG
jgi:hypothetical protein